MPWCKKCVEADGKWTDEYRADYQRIYQRAYRRSKGKVVFRKYVLHVGGRELLIRYNAKKESLSIEVPWMKAPGAMELLKDVFDVDEDDVKPAPSPARPGMTKLVVECSPGTHEAGIEQLKASGIRVEEVRK